MAQKLRFSRGLKAKVPGAVTARVPAHCSCSRSDAARRNIYRLGAHRLNTRSNNGEGKDFFTFEGLSNV